jgi:RHS repeat-associated protein
MFLYDPFGRRIQKSGPLGTTTYVYDGANIVAEYDGTGALAAKYAQGAGVDQPLAMWRGGQSGYYQADGLGSITSLTDAAGSPLTTYTYDAFGWTTSTGALFNPFQYAGREWDQETGLYYYRARYYDPLTGRFTSEDPARDGLNFFAYVRNNPINRTDPFGLWDTDTHSKLIWNALEPCGVDHETIYLLQEASKAFDEATGLDPDWAYAHSMKSPGQSSQDAIAKRNQFVATSLHSAWAHYESGEPGGGPGWQEPFAQAIHTLMDMTSPLHMKNGQPITWPSGNNFYKHGGGFFGRETWNEMVKTPGLMEYNVTLIRDAWQSMTGSRCQCQN